MTHDSCFVCMTDRKQPPRAFCSCSMRLHDSCLLEMARATGRTSCPVCGACYPLRVVRKPSPCCLAPFRAPYAFAVLGGLAFAASVVLWHVLVERIWFGLDAPAGACAALASAISVCSLGTVALALLVLRIRCQQHATFACTLDSGALLTLVTSQRL